MVLFILAIIVILFIFYTRYFPISGVPLLHFKDIEWDKVVVVDLRDYNVSYKHPVNGAINIPVAYLKRHYHEIPNKVVHVVVSSSIEKNIGIRFLRKKGFRVSGYTISTQNRLLLDESFIVKEGSYDGL